MALWFPYKTIVKCRWFSSPPVEQPRWVGYFGRRPTRTGRSAPQGVGARYPQRSLEMIAFISRETMICDFMWRETIMCCLCAQGMDNQPTNFHEIWTWNILCLSFLGIFISVWHICAIFHLHHFFRWEHETLSAQVILAVSRKLLPLMSMAQWIQ